MDQLWSRPGSSSAPSTAQQPGEPELRVSFIEAIQEPDGTRSINLRINVKITNPPSASYLDFREFSFTLKMSWLEFKYISDAEYILHTLGRPLIGLTASLMELKEEMSRKGPVDISDEELGKSSTDISNRELEDRLHEESILNRFYLCLFLLSSLVLARGSIFHDFRHDFSHVYSIILFIHGGCCGACERFHALV